MFAVDLNLWDCIASSGKLVLIRQVTTKPSKTVVEYTMREVIFDGSFYVSTQYAIDLRVAAIMAHYAPNQLSSACHDIVILFPTN